MSFVLLSLPFPLHFSLRLPLPLPLCFSPKLIRDGLSLSLLILPRTCPFGDLSLQQGCCLPPSLLLLLSLSLPLSLPLPLAFPLPLPLLSLLFHLFLSFSLPVSSHLQMLRPTIVVFLWPL